MRGLAATTIAGAFALSAFSIAVMAGLASGNPAASVLVRALIAMLVCYPVGLILGTVVQRIITDQIEQHRADHPEPEAGAEDGLNDDGIQVVEEDGEEVLVV